MCRQGLAEVLRPRFKFSGGMDIPTIATELTRFAGAAVGTAAESDLTATVHDELARWLGMTDGTPAFEECSHYEDKRVPNWWKLYGSSTFPNLAKAAKTVFAIVPSSCTIERVWSMYGTTITPSRSRLLPQRATEMLVTKWSSVARTRMKTIAAKQAVMEDSCERASSRCLLPWHSCARKRARPRRSSFCSASQATRCRYA